MISPVKLTIGIKLNPTPEQAEMLRLTLERANAAANECSRLAWEAQQFRQFDLHRIAYVPMRGDFGISAQLTVRVIAKVADAYKLDKDTQRTFHKHGAVAFDDRILRYGDDYVSIWTLSGRQKIPFVCGERERNLLPARQGESDLAFRNGKWFLFPIINVVESEPITPEGYLGVDLGIARIATDSDGESHSGAHTRNMRKRHKRLRRKLQSKQTKSAKRKLKNRRRKEALFAKDINHRISKRIVAKAKRTKRAIVIEDLKGIRARVRARKARRYELHSWAFYQLKTFLEYKAALAGVPVIVIDPRNTSRECSECGHIAKSNRRSQSRFQCRDCGHRQNADVNAARVIASRAAFNQPNAGESHPQSPTTARFGA